MSSGKYGYDHVVAASLGGDVDVAVVVEVSDVMMIVLICMGTLKPAPVWLQHASKATH